MLVMAFSDVAKHLSCSSLLVVDSCVLNHLIHPILYTKDSYCEWKELILKFVFTSCILILFEIYDVNEMVVCWPVRSRLLIYRMNAEQMANEHIRLSKMGICRWYGKSERAMANAFVCIPSDVGNWANVKGCLFGTNDFVTICLLAFTMCER